MTSILKLQLHLTSGAVLGCWGGEFRLIGAFGIIAKGETLEELLSNL